MMLSCFLLSILVLDGRLNPTLGLVGPTTITTKIQSSLTTTIESSSPSCTPTIVELQLAQFCSGNEPWICIPNAVPPLLIRGLKQDALSLRAAGFGSLAGIVPGTQSAVAATSNAATDFRSNVHQTWLPTSNSIMLGNMAARQDLIRWVHDLEGTVSRRWPDLSCGQRRRQVELSYLHYSPGSFYKRHVDASPGLSNQRVVSWLLYLGDPHNDDPWQETQDGGQLRLYNPQDPFEIDANICPQAGNLVVFDSCQVPHEVLYCNRERLAVVGWFGSAV